MTAPPLPFENVCGHSSLWRRQQGHPYACLMTEDRVVSLLVGGTLSPYDPQFGRRCFVDGFTLRSRGSKHGVHRLETLFRMQKENMLL